VNEKSLENKTLKKQYMCIKFNFNPGRTAAKIND
jgi:hypothetical protein